MSELIRPSMGNRNQRPIQRTTKLDRMKLREGEMAVRVRQLYSLKTSTLPIIFPTLTTPKDSKCRKCTVDKENFLTYHDWLVDPVDVLTLQTQVKQSWFEWFQMWLLRRNLSSSMDSIVVHPAHIKMLKNIQKKFPKRPLVFVLQPTATPQIDIPLIHFVLSQNDVKLPLIICDSKFQELPRTKAFTATSCSEISESKIAIHLQSGGNILIMLNDEAHKDFSKVLNASGFGLATEVFLVPISINSEKLRKEYARSSLGIVKINFHEPYTVGDLLKSNDSQSAEVDDDLRKVRKIKQHLRYDIAMKGPLMSTNALAFLLMTKFRQGATIETLADGLAQLRQDMMFVDFGFEGTNEDVVEHAIELLSGNLIEVDDKTIKIKRDNIVELSEYAAPFVPHFAIDSILVVAACALKDREHYIDFNELISKAKELCVILQFEIPFKKPCEDFKNFLDEAFDRCSLQGLLNKPIAKVFTDSERRAMRQAKHLGLDDDDDDYDDYSNDDGYRSRNPEDEVTINEELMNKIESLKNVTMPLLDAYLTLIYTLKEFKKNEKITEMFLVAVSERKMREDLEDGNCKYWESSSINWMQGCVNYLKLIGIIEVHDNSKISHNGKSSIRSLIDDISYFFDNLS